MTDPRRTVALVLAAGSATRFGSPKALAPLDGRPLLQHVVDAALDLGLAATVVVLGDAAEAIDAAIDWRLATRVRNLHPEAGLSSSVRVGLDAVREIEPSAEAVVVLLGDQPFVRRDVVQALLAAPLPVGCSVVAPRYSGGGGPNPLLLTRDAWLLAEHVSGDRGFGPVIAAHPELVVEVPVEGDNPDIDTPADLAVAAWAAQVRANREQVDRFREVPDGADFYGPVSPMFVADPRRTDDPLLERLLGLARPDDVWLDIGAGAGRFALPLALAVREVVAIDPSEGMLAALRGAMAEHGIGDIRIVHGRWPLAPDEIPADGVPHGDVALIAHLGYDIERIGPFLDAMEAAAKRLCVAVLMDRQPSAQAHAFWPPVHGEERVPLPALREFIALLRSRGRAPTVEETAQPARGFESLDDAERFVRRQLWVQEGGAKDRRFRSILRQRAHERDGRWYLDERPPAVGLVTWTPHLRGRSDDVGTVLVAYATKYGSTREIAEAIGEVIEDAGFEVEVLPARDVRDVSVYDAVVIGSALYSAHWQRDANRFVRAHRAALRERPVWAFSSGPLDQSANLMDIPMTEHVRPEFETIAPRGHRTFGGRLLPGTPGLDEAVLATHRTGDFRDFVAIRRWAAEIASALQAEADDCR